VRATVSCWMGGYGELLEGTAMASTVRRWRAAEGRGIGLHGAATASTTQ
jgi:hypothetical protein